MFMTDNCKDPATIVEEYFDQESTTNLGIYLNL